MLKGEFREQIAQIKQVKMKPKALISGHGTPCPYENASPTMQLERVGTNL